MRGLTWALAGAVVLLAMGCGSVAKTSSTSPSETPDAVATTEPSSLPTSDGGSTDAKVVVDGAGFSLGDYQEVGYGLVLKNTSTSMDAEQVQVTVNLLDASGAVLQTDNQTLNLIPAGGTFYFGGDISVTKGDKPRKMEAFVDVGSSEAAQYTLPKVSNVRVVVDPYSGLSVKGQVKNDLDATLSQFALIGCVLFDANDKVVGGGFAYLNGNLRSGRTAAFEVLNGASATPASKVKRAEASMDNEVE
jgi:hypothetical protein